jgi:putative transposase
MTPRIVLQLMQMMLALVQALTAGRMDLAMENLALRQQVAALKKDRPRPRLTDLDRLFWVALRDRWADWANALIIVRPETVVRWHP